MEATFTLLTIPEAAERLRVSRAKLYGLIRDGAFPLRKIGRKSLIAATDLDQYVTGLPAVNGRA